MGVAGAIQEEVLMRDREERGDVNSRKQREDW